MISQIIHRVNTNTGWAALWVACMLYGCTSATGPDNKRTLRTHTVEIKGMAFLPAEITVNKGDTVIFINRDLVDHDITEADRKLWFSSPLHPGQSWSKVITGSANYFCSLHVVMKGKIIAQ